MKNVNCSTFFIKQFFFVKQLFSSNASNFLLAILGIDKKQLIKKCFSLVFISFNFRNRKIFPTTISQHYQQIHNETSPSSFIGIYTAETYIRHPNSYLPKYNIQSETDGESIPLTHSNDAMVGGGSNRMGQQRMLMKNGVDIGPHQIVQSDEDDVPAYGFPSQKRRNRIEQSDFEYNKGGKFIYSYTQHTSTHACRTFDSAVQEGDIINIMPFFPSAFY